MSVSLQKGQKVSLSKDNAGLSSILVGLGWDEAKKQEVCFHSSRSLLTVTLLQFFSETASSQEVLRT